MKRSLLEIINEVLKENKINELNPDASLKEDLGMDSLDLAYLTVLIEDEYGIDVFESGFSETIRDLQNKIND